MTPPRDPGDPVSTDRLTPFPDEAKLGPTQSDNSGDPDGEELSQDPEVRP